MRITGFESYPVIALVAVSMMLFGTGCFSDTSTTSETPQVLDEPTAARSPNIILCMTDDQGWGDTGYNGHPVLKTPHLDLMAKEGVRFDRFYAGAPVCSPTRGSCLTGRHPYRYGITFASVGHMKREELTLAEALKRESYLTGHFGKWHLGTLTTEIEESNLARVGDSTHFSPPWENGFDVCFSTEAKVPTYWKKEVYKEFGTHYWTGPGQMVSPDKVIGDDSKLIMDHALPFVRRAAREQVPFLAVIWFHAPHAPIVSAPPYTDGFTEHRDYYGCLTAVDEQMGRLRSELKNLGIEDNTMIWFCSDNGPEGDTNSPGRTNGLRGRKRSLYEGGIRVPGLLVWPAKIRTPRVISTPCSTSDFFPTVIDILKERPPELSSRPIDGVSLLPLIEVTTTSRSSPIAFESSGQTALIEDRFKIVRSDPKVPYELYDLVDDPSEERNLAADQPDRVRAMAARLDEWQASCHKSAEGEDYLEAKGNHGQETP